MTSSSVPTHRDNSQRKKNYLTQSNKSINLASSGKLVLFNGRRKTRSQQMQIPLFMECSAFAGFFRFLPKGNRKWYRKALQ